MDILLQAAEFIENVEMCQTLAQIATVMTSGNSENMASLWNRGKYVYKLAKTPPPDHVCSKHCEVLKRLQFCPDKHCITKPMGEINPHLEAYREFLFPPKKGLDPVKPEIPKENGDGVQASLPSSMSSENSPRTHNHKINEKKRRDSMKGLMKNLQNLLPNAANKGYVETNLAAVAYIKELKQQQKVMRSEKVKLLERRLELATVLEALREVEEKSQLLLRNQHKCRENICWDGEVIDICSSEKESEEGEIVLKKRKGTPKKQSEEEPQTKWIQLPKRPEMKYRIGGRQNMFIHSRIGGRQNMFIHSRMSGRQSMFIHSRSIQKKPLDLSKDPKLPVPQEQKVPKDIPSSTPEKKAPSLRFQVKDGPKTIMQENNALLIIPTLVVFNGVASS